MRETVARRGVVRACRAALPLVLLAATACSYSSSHRYRTLEEAWRAEAPAGPVDRAGAEAAPLFRGVAFLERRTLVRAVLERNPTLRAARHAWRAALERVPQVTALEDPMLGAGVAPLSLGSSRVDDAPKLDLSQKLPFPGKLRLRGEAALGEAEAASHDFAAVRLRLAMLASLVFDDYYLSARSLEINDEHVALLEEFQRIATVRYEAGEASQQDPLQAEVELTHAIHKRIMLETQQRLAAEQIRALLHLPSGGSLPPPPAHSDVPTGLSAAAEPFVEEALSERPELAAAAARVAAEESRVSLARREYFPDVTLVGSYNGIMQEEDLQPFVGIQLAVPLQLERRRAAVDEAEARLEQARSQRLALEDEVRFGVRSGVDRLVEAHHVMELFADRLLPAARDRVAAARSGFETGRNSFLALIDAERDLRNVELGYEEAIANLGRRHAELDRARGRIPGLEW